MRNAVRTVPVTLCILAGAQLATQPASAFWIEAGKVAIGLLGKVFGAGGKAAVSGGAKVVASTGAKTATGAGMKAGAGVGGKAAAGGLGGGAATCPGGRLRLRWKRDTCRGGKSSCAHCDNKCNATYIPTASRILRNTKSSCYRI